MIGRGPLCGVLASRVGYGRRSRAAGRGRGAHPRARDVRLAPASSLVLRRAAPGELPQFEVAGQRQSRGLLPCLVREDRGQGGLDGLAGHDLIVLIDEDDLERLRRVERCDAGVLDLHDHGGLHLVVRHRRAGRLQRVAHGCARDFGTRQLAADGGVLPGIPLALLLQLGDEVPAGPLQGRVAEGIIVVAHAVSLRGSGGVAVLDEGVVKASSQASTRRARNSFDGIQLMAFGFWLLT